VAREVGAGMPGWQRPAAAPRAWIPGMDEEGHLPRARALEVAPQECADGEGIEAERRLAHVAFTRA